MHQTTLAPGKLELLSSWLPAQPWYAGGDRPDLARAGGFRLDDPGGEVGLEFMIVRDSSGGGERYYHVPLSYRGAPLASKELTGAGDAALVGMAEHGVLGTRWVYDGLHDPVLATPLLALIRGQADAQDQNQSDTPDPTVTSQYSGPGGALGIRSMAVITGPHGTDLLLDTVPASGGPAGPVTQLTLRVRRLLEPDGDEGGPAIGSVRASWTGPDGTSARGLLAVLTG
jgi:Maltokinase N-terminal cap domain